MTAAWINQLMGSRDDKRRYRQYKARAKRLSGGYRTAIEALDRYLMYRGLITKGVALLQ